MLRRKQKKAENEIGTKKKNINWRIMTPLLIIGIVLLGVVGFIGYNAWQRAVTNAGKENALGRQIDGRMDINNVSVQLGSEEYVAGPVSFSDNGYFTEKDLKGRAYGFMANQTSYAFRLDEKGKPIIPSSASKLKRHVILSRDQRPKEGTPERAVFDREEAKGLHPDRCGAWMLNAIRKNPKNKKHWFGWYHGEDRCDYANNGQTHMTLAYVESMNAGKTWRKIGYPNNRVITVDNALKRDTDTDDTGGGRTMIIGNYFYMFFRSSGKVKKTGTDGKASTILVMDSLHVARSKISDFGKPGTWWKWYCGDSGRRETCGYTEPGLGGRSTPISATAGTKPTSNLLPSQMRYISYNQYLKRYIAIRANGKVGFSFSASEGNDFLTWKRKTETIFPAVSSDDDFTVQNWNYGGNPKQCKKDGTPTSYECKQLYAYTSIIGIDGHSDKNTNQEFYLYYTKLYPGAEHDQRYLLRRKVKLIVPASSGTSPSAVVTKTTRVQLSIYENKRGDLRITSELPHPKSNYRFKSKAGYVLSAPAKDYQPLFECQRPSGEYYTKRVNTSAPYGLPAGGNPPTKCATTDKLIRRVGWVSPTRTSEATVPIYGESSSSRSRSAPIGYGLPALTSN